MSTSFHVARRGLRRWPVAGDQESSSASRPIHRGCAGGAGPDFVRLPPRVSESRAARLGPAACGRPRAPVCRCLQVRATLSFFYVLFRSGRRRRTPVVVLVRHCNRTAALASPVADPWRDDPHADPDGAAVVNATDMALAGRHSDVETTTTPVPGGP